MDYFLINQDLFSLCPDAKIHSCYKSDHNVIFLEINISKNEKGRGSWKLNSTLLENKELIILIKKEINLIKQTYAIPVYDLDNLDQIEDSELQLTIPDSLFLDTLLCQVRGLIISFSKKLARERRELEKKLTTEI